MSRQPCRLHEGGLIDRNREIAFTFNGRHLHGYAGDSLASALLANNVHLVGRSFKYHRPRGIVCSGSEEPNAMVQLERGAFTQPNLRATQIPLYDGLAAVSQNCWPTVSFDIGAANSLVSRMLPAGFYYKTFMWPPSKWMSYEHLIRKMAGMGKAPTEPDPDHYAHRHAHCDVLIAGGGPAGLAAALAAGRTGARVIIADENWEFGGNLLADHRSIGDVPALEWVKRTTAMLAAMPQVILLKRSTVFGYFDHNFLAIAEHVTGTGDSLHVRQRIWKVRAKQVVLATGAIERPLIFADNDRPGIMLSSAVRTYVNRFAVRPGRRAVVFTNNDSAYATALDLARVGVDVAAVIDAREAIPAELTNRLRAVGIKHFVGHAVIRARGNHHVTAVDIASVAASGFTGNPQKTLDCDLLCMSGGFNPAVHLFSQSKGKLRYDDRLAAFIPDISAQSECSAGAARGTMALTGCLVEGSSAGAKAAHKAGFGDGTPPSVPPVAEDNQGTVQPLWTTKSAARPRRKFFVDFQNDVTVADVELAAREGYSAVEHLKRYTTLGMGTDQGKLSNITGLAILSEILDAPIPAIGTTTFRPPYTAVTLGALAGTETGAHFAPVRRTPMHAWHEQAGARFTDAGLWKRPRFYPTQDESDIDAVNREALGVRTSVGLVDVSTLGRIDIKGRDSAEFLDRVYVNSWKNLAIGKARYGLMLREDGMVLDDGTTTHLAKHHFLMTTTTANAAKVMVHLEYLLQVVWPELEVHLTSVTEQWAAMALAGPNSRAVLTHLTDCEVDNAALPYMGYLETRIAGIPARIFRISFSGELAYEINVPADYGTALWQALLEAGRPYQIVPYGTEAMAVLRIEKGHVAGMELDGRTTPDDLGLGRMLHAKKDYVGKRSLERPSLSSPGRKQLVGLLATDDMLHIPRGAQLIADDAKHPRPCRILGHVTSTCYSPVLKRSIALALLAGGRSRIGETLYATSPLSNTTAPVEIVHHVFIDSDAKRLRN
jgi:sarcosine oxidase subunit alpha